MPDGTLAFGIIVCFLGSASEGERVIASLRSFGKPMMDMLAERPYLEMQSLFDKDIPPGKRYYNKAHNARCDHRTMLSSSAIGMRSQRLPSM